MERNGIRQHILEGIDESRLKANDASELDRFRSNIARVVGEILRDAPDAKKTRIEAFKVGALELIAQIPVITPVITAMFQVITGEDLGSKIDGLGDKIDRLAVEVRESREEILQEIRKSR